YGHEGDWRAGKTAWQAARLNQPLMAFQAPAHPGQSRTLSFAQVNTDAVAITAMKKAEASDEIIIRLRELTGQGAKDVHVKFSGGLASAREVNGQEREIGPATIDVGGLVVDEMPGYRLRAFAVRPTTPEEPKKQTVLEFVE